MEAYCGRSKPITIHCISTHHICRVSDIWQTSLLILGATGSAQTLDLDVVSISREACSFRLLGEKATDGRIIKLDDLVAFAADEKLSRMNRFRHFAGDEGVDGVDAVDDSRIEQKLEGAVNGWWGLCALSLFQSAQDVIGPDGSVALCNQLEHTPTDGSELKAALSTHSLGSPHDARYASVVIVLAT